MTPVKDLKIDEDELAARRAYDAALASGDEIVDFEIAVEEIEEPIK